MNGNDQDTQSTEPTALPEDAALEAELDRIKAMPKEVGVLLVVAGLGGILLPGPVGTPLLVLGGVILWPKAFNRVELFMVNRLPKMHGHALKQVKRLLSDLDRRYPMADPSPPDKGN